ncbi:MAG: hypothetical protein EOO03_08530, partial [Chitinophagaceae bacterium]
MKVFTILFSLLFSSALVSAQLSTYEWSNKVATATTAKKSLVDAGGNIYVWITAGAPVTIGSTTYTSTSGSTGNFIVKYDPNGSITWSREVKFVIYNMSFNTDSTSILLCGLIQSNYNSLDMGNGITIGTGFNSAGIIAKISAATNGTEWVQGYDPTIPTLTTAKPVSAIYEVNNRMFAVQDLKMRRLDVNGVEVWNRVITANGTTYSLENKNFNSFADAAGNSFYIGLSDNGNSTYMTLNGSTYTLLGGNNVCRTYFSLDENGNTNWVRKNVNFQVGKNVQVLPTGELVLGGYNIYNGYVGESNHPFKVDFCSRLYNVFKANLKTAATIWEAQAPQIGNVNSSGFHVGGDGNLYLLSHVQSASSIFYNLPTTARAFRPIAAPGNYLMRINSQGIPDSIFSVNTFSGTSVTTLDFSVINLHRTAAGKLVM